MIQRLEKEKLDAIKEDKKSIDLIYKLKSMIESHCRESGIELKRLQTPIKQPLMILLNTDFSNDRDV